MRIVWAAFILGETCDCVSADGRSLLRGRDPPGGGSPGQVGEPGLVQRPPLRCLGGRGQSRAQTGRRAVLVAGSGGSPGLNTSVLICAVGSEVSWGTWGHGQGLWRRERFETDTKTRVN